jgi:hypothetical protein
VALKGGQLDENGFQIAIIRNLRIDASCVEVANFVSCNLTFLATELEQFQVIEIALLVNREKRDVNGGGPVSRKLTFELAKGSTLLLTKYLSCAREACSGNTLVIP